MKNPQPLDRFSISAQLTAKAQQMDSLSLRDLFNHSDNRFANFSRNFEGLLFDFSKTHVDDETLDLLAKLADEADLSAGIELLFSGAVINPTEQRAAMHMALRSSKTEMYVEGENVAPMVKTELDKLSEFVRKVRGGSWIGHTGKQIKTVVNIGIGGSDLGPKLVCHALSAYARQSLELKFISSIDANHVYPILTSCDPETTLFIVASKSFGTDETLTNANTCRDWLLSSMAQDFSAVAKHFVALSTNAEKVCAFGIDPRNMFQFWDWVGGRYSIWSVIGMPLALQIGMDRFREFLAGAEAMDQQFASQPWQQNLPALLGLLGIWNQNYLDFRTHAILPYDDYLRFWPDYLQQLEMESNGKSMDKSGQPLPYDTCPIIWGGQGNNGQHAFYQLLHQGTRRIFHEFFAPVSATNPIGEHHEKLLANCLAQSQALMLGRNEDEARLEMASQGVSDSEIERLMPYRTFSGNRPSHTFLYDALTPRLLGSLIALYEHKVFVEGWLWGINSFDQWGVELGKKLAVKLKPIVSGETPADDTLDASTRGLVDYIQQVNH